MKKISIFWVLIFIQSIIAAAGAGFSTPAQLRSYQLPTTYVELKDFVKDLAAKCEWLSYEIIGQSVEGREIFAVRAMAADLPASDNRLRILLFSQQHGNEQSSKEAALLLMANLANGKHPEWLRNIELWIVPQVNPDASEVNERRNARNLDLNRDHIMLESPEIQALHALFQKVMPHVTIDVHEYQPYRQSWAEFGGFKFFDVQVGILTNPNIAFNIKNYSYRIALPAIENRLLEAGFSFHNYLIGPAPHEGLIRFSTVDIDDGRQGFGILGGMSFIYEGINGRDNFAHNLERRTLSQTLALESLIDVLHNDRRKVKRMVNHSRERLMQGRLQRVAIRMDHFRDSNPLLLPLISSQTQRDTIAIVENFHPIVRPTHTIDAPAGYLIPKSDSLLVGLLQRHNIKMTDDFQNLNRVYAYMIIQNRIVEAEAADNAFPLVQRVRITKAVSPMEYFFVPLNQLKSAFIVLTLEPESQLGLAQYGQFQHLFVEGKIFPILRAE